MPEERFGERTEPATPRRRQEARERGHVARSQDLSSAAVLLAAILALRWGGRDLLGALSEQSKLIFGGAGRFEISASNVLGYGVTGGIAAGKALLPFLCAVFAGGLLGNLLQIGFVFSGAPLEFRLDRLNPIAGLGRIFSGRGLVRLLEVMVKMAIITVIVWLTLRDQTWQFLMLMEMDVPEIVGLILSLSWLLCIRVAMALLVFGLVDYAYQRYQYERDLRMSRAEVQEELKRLEGDPEVKRRRRRIQRNLALQRMMAAVPKAAVVITNPTHLAVALAYEPEQDAAPRVVAKGAGYVAERIRDIAAEHGIQIVQKPDLARVLYQSVDIGRIIPEELYLAVSEILAYVYTVTRRTLPRRAATA